MSRQRLTNGVIQYLQHRNFKFTRFLGAGGFADIIGVLDPSGREVAVKIVQRQDIWAIEDKYWPRLKHPNIIEVYDVIKIKDLAVRLYIMPILPRSLDQIIESKEFKNDPDSFKRMNKWIFQILSAVGYLHSKGLAHLDIKTDNVLIDSDDNAVLADFTGLNFTKDPIERLISPDVFHPPECFVHPANKNIRGERFDMWTYGLLVLNAMTGQYFAKKATFSSCSMNWSTHLLPILQKALKKSKFEKLMKKAFPKARLSATDLNLVHHFTQFLLNVKQEERPTAVRAKKHLLIKKISNPFTQDSMQSMSPKFNPFKKVKRQPDRYSRGDASFSKMKTDDDCLSETTQDEVSFLLAEDSIEDDGSESDETDEDSHISMATNDISDCFFQFVPVNPRFQDCWEEETQEDAEGFWIDKEIFQRVVPASALEAVELETVESSVPEVSVLTRLPLQEASSGNGEPAEEVRALTPLPLQAPSSYPVEEAIKQKKKGTFRKQMSALFFCYPCKVKKKNRYD